MDEDLDEQLSSGKVYICIKFTDFVTDRPLVNIDGKFYQIYVKEIATWCPEIKIDKEHDEEEEVLHDNDDDSSDVNEEEDDESEQGEGFEMNQFMPDPVSQTRVMKILMGCKKIILKRCLVNMILLKKR